MVSEPTIAQRHCAIASTRRTAAAALRRALTFQRDAASEFAIHRRWLHELYKDPSLSPVGWYRPPPSGLSVLVGHPPDFGRLSFGSLRDAVNAPSTANMRTDDSVLFAYCSPVHRRTAMIGDFQMTVYSGAVQAVREHLCACLHLVRTVAAVAEPGMTFSDLYFEAAHHIRALGLHNRNRSTSDASALPNIGHTVPWSDEDYDPAVWAALESGDPTAIAFTIRRAIALITPAQHRAITANTAFTIEPQLVSPQGIQASFHLIVAFQGGVKTVLENFDDIFDVFGMFDYLPRDMFER